MIEKLAVRRNSLITSLVLHLVYSDSLSRAEIEKYPLKLEIKKSVQQAGAVMIKRLYEKETLDDYENGSSLEDDEPMSFQDLLRKNIEKQNMNASKPASVEEELNTIPKNFKIYDLHKTPLMESLSFLCAVSSQHRYKAKEISPWHLLSSQKVDLHFRISILICCAS